MQNFLLLGFCFVAGYLIRLSQRFPETTPKVLNSFIIYISLPALTLLYVQKLKIELELLMPISMAWLLFGLAFVFFKLLGKRLNWQASTVACLILVCGLGNTSFLGLPMIEVFWGKEGLPIGLIIDQLGSFMVLSTLGIFLAAKYGISANGKQSLVKEILTFPPFISVVAALLLQSIDYPPIVFFTLERLGQTLTPLALFSVGFQLRFSHINTHKLQLSVGLIFKLIAAPAVLFFIYSMLTPDRGLVFNVTIFEAAMPPMITAAVLATEYKLNKDLAAILVGIGIVFSFITLTLWWMILS